MMPRSEHLPYARHRLCPIATVPHKDRLGTVTERHKHLATLRRLMRTGPHPFVGHYVSHIQRLLCFFTIMYAPQRLHLRYSSVTFFFIPLRVVRRKPL